jgi:hypothetical protein
MYITALPMSFGEVRYNSSKRSAQLCRSSSKAPQTSEAVSMRVATAQCVCVCGDIVRASLTSLSLHEVFILRPTIVPPRTHGQTGALF